MKPLAQEKGHPDTAGAPSLPPTPLLVIGYGNDLCRDDGAGQHVARRIRALNLAGVATIDVHQLLPELCEDVAHAARVICVDATIHTLATPAELAPLDEIPPSAHFAHSASPQGLVAMAAALYDAHPEAAIIKIRAIDMDFGEQLTPECEEGVRMAVDIIVRMAAG